MADMGENTSYPELGFARLAGDFISAAKLVTTGKDDAGVVSGQGLLPAFFPFLFLIGHGLELAYKAVLLVDGATEKDLKQIGHDLVRCRRKVQVCRPSLLEDLEKPGTEEIVGMIGPYYNAKALEYHMIAHYSGLPVPPNRVVTITAGTVKNIEEWLRRGVRQKIRDARNGT